MRPNSNRSAACRLYDAHNHLQDERLASFGPEIQAALTRENVQRIVVNGSCEQDWPAVLSLARQHPGVIPSFGFHPWYVKQRSAAWRQTLASFLDQAPAAVGEIGLDRWIKDHDLDEQTEVFEAQMRLAAERNLPASIHCLRAWGRLLELLRNGPRPACGFLLHSFGGPQEMIEPLSDLGAYFSLPGYYAHERKARQRDAFKHVPPDRLLLETDAPDQPLPDHRVLYPLPQDSSGKVLNHPGNLTAVYQFASELVGEPVEKLACRIEDNFLRLFGLLCR